MIKHEYKVNFLIDNLPSIYIDMDEYNIGFPVGEELFDDEFIVNTHVDITIKYTITP